MKLFMQLSDARAAAAAAAHALVTESDGESGLRASRARAGGKALNEHLETLASAAGRKQAIVTTTEEEVTAARTRDAATREGGHAGGP